MAILGTLASLALIAFILHDGFEAMVLPRRVTRPYRFTRLFYRTTWSLWRAAAGRLPVRRRQTFLSVFGPLSLLALLATWAAGLIVGFGLLHWFVHSPVKAPDDEWGLGMCVYLSGTTFFTLGYGDIVPLGGVGRFLAVVEAGMGFGFMAVVIGYLPVLYQAFSRREATISLLDARAGSPPSAAQMLLRLGQARNLRAVEPFLAEWERWSAELLEGQLSFPVLAFYRSQHDNQSWLAALTVILDTCALLIAGVKSGEAYQAQLTFAIARHAAVDLALVFKSAPVAPEADRLSPEQLGRLRESLRGAGLACWDGEAAGRRLAELRGMYEPFVNALGRYFLLALPPIAPEKAVVDNWQTTAWTRRAPGIGQLPVAGADGQHFE